MKNNLHFTAFTFSIFIALTGCESNDLNKADTNSTNDSENSKDTSPAEILKSEGNTVVQSRYSKICVNGEFAGTGSCPSEPILGNNYNHWGCTRDNDTGFTWQVHLAKDSDTPYIMNHNYQPVTDYRDKINQQGLCGRNDWDTPTLNELTTLVYCSDGKYGKFGNVKTLNKNAPSILKIPSENVFPSIFFICASNNFANGVASIIDHSNFANNIMNNTVVSTLSPTINTKFFPLSEDNFSMSDFITSSIGNSVDGKSAWQINFNDGRAWSEIGTTRAHVRLVNKKIASTEKVISTSTTIREDISSVSSNEKQIDLSKTNVTTVNEPDIKRVNITPLAISALNKLYGVTNDNGSVKIAKDKLASVWFEQSFKHEGDNYHVVFIQKQPIDDKGELDGMNGRGIQVDAVTYSQSINEEWRLNTEQKDIAEVGNYGKAPNVVNATVLELSSDRTAFLIDDEGKGENDFGEEFDKWQETFVFLNSNHSNKSKGWVQAGINIGWKYVGRIDISQNNNDFCGENSINDFKKCWDYNGKLTLVENSKQYPDLLMTKKGTEIDEKGNIVDARNAVYTYHNDRYEVSKAKPSLPITSEQQVKNVPKSDLSVSDCKNFVPSKLNPSEHTDYIAAGQPKERAYFYNAPDTNCRVKAYIISGDHVSATEEYQNDFDKTVFIKSTYTNEKSGKSVSGWMRADSLQFTK